MNTASTSTTLTERVYGLIAEKDWDGAIETLSGVLQQSGPSQAVLSLLGHCQYSAEAFTDAATSYQALCDLSDCAKSPEYQLLLAQCLQRSGAAEDAMKVLAALEEQDLIARDDLLLGHLMKLRAAVNAETGDIRQARAYLQSALGGDDPEAVVSAAALAYREGLFDEALAGYSEALEAGNHQLAYNQALCSYKLKDYGRAMETVVDAIGRAHETHPELLAEQQSPDAALASIADPSYLAVLQESRLVECFNLKASIEYDSGDKAAAAKSLGEHMPTMLEEDRDAITLHNEAIICDAGGGNLDAGCFKKLQYLMSDPQSSSYPPETFANILLLYLQNGYEDLAATLLAENTDLTYELLSEELFSFLDASLLAATSPDDALTQFDGLGKEIAKRIRKASKLVGDAENEGDDVALAAAHSQLDDAMRGYLPVLMAMAKIHWEKKDYEAVERVLRQSGDFCSDGKACATNLAHAYFMQGKHREASICYEPLVQGAIAGGGEGAILDIPPVVLANLCVSFILSDQNDKAEVVMSLVERAEEMAMSRNDHGDSSENGTKSTSSAGGNDDKPPLLHLSTINLVIGTLYCQKNNYDFGVAMVCKSLEPYEHRLSSDTWHYCKTCLLGLLDKLSKQMVSVSDETTSQVMDMLNAVAKFGTNLSSSIGEDKYSYVPSPNNTISAEARKLKLAFLRLA